MSIRPEDFSSETPPIRVIGVECEYNLQLPADSQHMHHNFINQEQLRKSGVVHQNSYLGSAWGSGRAYPDVGHLEFATAEALGPASAAVEDIDGIDRISDIVTRSGHSHAGLYRLAGTYIPDGRVLYEEKRSSVGRSSGYHENYLAARSVLDDPLFDALLPTMLATRTWAMNGTLLPEGFVFSQKVWGIGGRPLERSAGRRTDPTGRPMISLPLAGHDIDTIGDFKVGSQWGRAEVRFADPGLSIVNRYLSFAAVSLTLRLVELQKVVGPGRLQAVCLVDPVPAAKLYARDLSLTKTAPAMDRKMVTSLDTQDRLLDFFSQLTTEVQLPEDEVMAITAIRGLVDALRSSNPAQADYAALARARIDFAPKHQFVSHGRPQIQVNAYSQQAMQRNLLWDRVLPGGNGRLYWAALAERDPMAEKVRELAQRAGGITRRARVRAAIVDRHLSNTVVRNWSQYIDRTDRIRSLGPPTGD